MKAKERLVGDWYMYLPEPQRMQAFTNMAKSTRCAWNDKVSNVRDAIIVGFIFEETPEGADYWADFINSPIVNFLSD